MLLGLLRDLLMRCHAFRPFMRFPVIFVEVVMLFDPNEISLRDLTLFSCIRF
jgi:hypothetical protein